MLQETNHNFKTMCGVFLDINLFTTILREGFYLGTSVPLTFQPWQPSTNHGNKQCYHLHPHHSGHGSWDRDCQTKIPHLTHGTRLCLLQSQVSIIMMPTLLSLVALQVVVKTTCSATSDDKVGIMTTHGFHCFSSYLTNIIFKHIFLNTNVLISIEIPYEVLP